MYYELAPASAHLSGFVVRVDRRRLDQHRVGLQPGSPLHPKQLAERHDPEALLHDFVDDAINSAQ